MAGRFRQECKHVKALRSALSMSRLLWLSGAALALGAMALAAAQAWFVHAERLRDERERLASLAAVLAEQTERAVQSADLILRDVAEQLSGMRLDSPEVVRGAYIQINDRINGVPQARAILVLDRDGNSVVDSASPEPRKFNGADRDHFQSHRDNPQHGLFIGEPIRARLNNLWTISLSRRIDAPGGGFGGVVTLALDPAYFSSFYGSIGMHPGSSVALIAASGILLARYPHDDALMGQALFGPRSKFSARIPPAPMGALTPVSPADGQKRLIAYKYLTRYPLLVTVGNTVAAAAGPAMPLIWVNIAAGAMIAALVLVLFSILARQARRRERLAVNLRQAKLESDRSRQQAISESRHKTQFWTSIGHELRSPLNAVIGFAEMLQSDAFGKPSQQQMEYAGYIKDAGAHLLGLINDLLDAAALEAGRLKVRNENVDLRQVADAALSMIGAQADKAGVKIVFETNGISPEVKGDEMRLRQVLLNLLSNAVKYSNAPGTVTLSFAAEPGGGIAVGVADTGIGMSQADIEQALLPFGRADNDEALKRSGTGLGLSIVKRLVELHDGRLEIASERGMGTTVTIRLPASRVVGLGGRVDAAQ